MANITMVNITQDDYGFPETFECMNRPDNETSTSVTLEFFYDLAFLKPNNTAEGPATLDLSRAYVEGSLVQQLAAYYGFWDGLACQGPLPNRTWFIKMSSLAVDVPNPNLCMSHSLVCTTAILFKKSAFVFLILYIHIFYM